MRDAERGELRSTARSATTLNRERENGEARDRIPIKILRKRIIETVQIKLEERWRRPDQDGGENRGIALSLVVLAHVLRSKADVKPQSPGSRQTIFVGLTG